MFLSERRVILMAIRTILPPPPSIRLQYGMDSFRHTCHRLVALYICLSGAQISGI